MYDATVRVLRQAAGPKEPEAMNTDVRGAVQLIDARVGGCLSLPHDMVAELASRRPPVGW